MHNEDLGVTIEQAQAKAEEFNLQYARSVVKNLNKDKI